LKFERSVLFDKLDDGYCRCGTRIVRHVPPTREQSKMWGTCHTCAAQRYQREQLAMLAPKRPGRLN